MFYYNFLKLIKTLKSVNSVASAASVSAATLIQTFIIVVTHLVIFTGFPVSSLYLLPVDRSSTPRGFASVIELILFFPWCFFFSFSVAYWLTLKLLYMASLTLSHVSPKNLFSHTKFLMPWMDSVISHVEVFSHVVPFFLEWLPFLFTSLWKNHVHLLRT